LLSLLWLKKKFNDVKGRPSFFYFFLLIEKAMMQAPKVVNYKAQFCQKTVSFETYENLAKLDQKSLINGFNEDLYGL
jgi:hypothetical protein